MHNNNIRLGSRFMHAPYILHSHRNGTPTSKLRLSAINDNNFWSMGLNRLLYLSAPDCITSNVQHRLLRMAQNNPAYTAHQTADAACTMLSTCFHHSNLTDPCRLLAKHMNPLEPMLSHRRCISYGLDIEGHVLGDGLRRCFIIMIRVKMCYNDCVNCGQLGHRQRQWNEWIAQLPARGIPYRRQSACIRKVRVSVHAA